jgi:hypothetical protein
MCSGIYLEHTVIFWHIPKQEILPVYMFRFLSRASMALLCGFDVMVKCYHKIRYQNVVGPLPKLRDLDEVMIKLLVFWTI